MDIIPTVNYIHHKIGLAWLKEKISKIWKPFESKRLMEEWLIEGKMSPKHKKHPYKVCPRCEKEQHISEYRLRHDRSLKKGYIVPRVYCNTCRDIQNAGAGVRKKRYAGDREERMKKTKKLLLHYFGERCSYIHNDGTQCDFKYVDPCQMEFDHKDPSTKKYNLTSGEAAAVSIDEYIEEVQKCQLLCANCHRLKTFVDHKL